MDRGAWRAPVHRVTQSDTTETTYGDGGEGALNVMVLSGKISWT